MLRNFAIPMLLLALLAVGFEGFREKERVRSAAPAAAENGTVHSADFGIIIPK